MVCAISDTDSSQNEKGSGGVDFLIKQSFYEEYDLNIMDSETEGILWLKFSSKFVHGTSFCCYVCYLPPIESTRAIDRNNLFDSLLYQIHIYGKTDQFFIWGDFNGIVLHWMSTKWN